MTTNKPEVVAWYTPTTRGTLPVVALNDRSQRGEPLIRLSDYEALQAKYERLLKHLQNLIDQTTPLEPDVAGLVYQHHRDSAELRRLCQARDEQRDGRLAALERAAKAEADVAQLVEALELAHMALIGYLPSHRNDITDAAISHCEQALAAHRKQGGVSDE